jgi:hypothetical protein
LKSLTSNSYKLTSNKYKLELFSNRSDSLIEVTAAAAAKALAAAIYIEPAAAVVITQYSRIRCQDVVSFGLYWVHAALPQDVLRVHDTVMDSFSKMQHKTITLSYTL